MPHFHFETNPDGTIRRILKDGQPLAQGVRLEQATAIVKTYFAIARRNLAELATTTDRETRRHLGLQAFLMSMTGLEAFTNTWFHLRALELGSEPMLTLISTSHGSPSRRLRDLVAMSGDGPLVDEEALIQRIFELGQLRNEMIHPKWEPSALSFGGDAPVVITGLVENRQGLFEDEALSREALLWCMLAVARVGQARGFTDSGATLFHWTGAYGATLTDILAELGLPPE